MSFFFLAHPAYAVTVKMLCFYFAGHTISVIFFTIHDRKWHHFCAVTSWRGNKFLSIYQLRTDGSSSSSGRFRKPAATFFALPRDGGKKKEKERNDTLTTQMTFCLKPSNVAATLLAAATVWNRLNDFPNCKSVGSVMMHLPSLVAAAPDYLTGGWGWWGVAYLCRGL